MTEPLSDEELAALKEVADDQDWDAEALRLFATIDAKDADLDVAVRALQAAERELVLARRDLDTSNAEASVLHAEIARLNSALHGAASEWHERGAERDRYKAALEQIVDKTMHSSAWDMARAALTEGEPRA